MNRRNKSIGYILTILLMFVGGFSSLHPASGSPLHMSDVNQVGQEVDAQPTEGELEVPTPTPTPTVPPPLPTQTPEPTFTPSPTATNEPAPTATVTETPTSVPTDPPTDPTATVPTETAVPSITPSATSIPPTVTPTPSPTPKPSGLRAQSIVSGSGCTQTSTTDIVAVDVAVNFSCEGRTGVAFIRYAGTVSAPTSGWQFQINGGTWRSTSTSVPTQLVGITGRSVPAFTIGLRPTSSVTAGTSGSVTVALTVVCDFGCNTSVTTYSTTLGATRAMPTPTAADLQLVCTPTSVTTGAGQPRTVTCIYSGKSTLATRQVVLTRLVIPAPVGWTIIGSAGTVAGTTLTVVPNATISYSATSPLSYSFTFTITPSCSAATTNQSMNMTSTFTYGATTGVGGATATELVARASQSSLAMSVQASSLNWNQVGVFTDTTVSGNFTYRIAASSCSGWAVTVAVSPYTYTGPYGGTAIPAANMTLTDAGNPVVITGSGTGVVRKDTSGSMSSSHKVLSAAIGAGTGTYEQQLDFSLTIPGRSRTGTYQSTVTLTSAAAP